MSRVQIITIASEDEGQRLDRWFKRRFPHIPHGRIEKLLRTGQMRINGKRSKGSDRIEAGDDIRIPPLPEPTETKVKKGPSQTDIRFMRNLVIYEDDELIALNKPFGLAVQGGTKTARHIDGMLPALGKGCRLVHRLDRDTSGVLLIARNAKSAAWAGRAFQSRRAEKVYWGVTNGVPHPKAGEIKGYMAKGRLDNRFGNKHMGKEIMVAVRHGEDGAKHAKTLYQSVQTAGVKAAFVAMQPLTGRTHQLRLHMQLLGAPIAGDPKYMTDRPLPGGLENKLHLHARKLTLPGPNGDISFEAPLPPHMMAAFEQLGFEQNAPIDDWEDLK